MRLSRTHPLTIAEGMPQAGGDLPACDALWEQEWRRHQKARYLRIKKCKEIGDKIERMQNEDEKDVLLYRYIRLMKWEDICGKMNFCWQHVHRIHNRALTNFRM